MPRSGAATRPGTAMRSGDAANDSAGVGGEPSGGQHLRLAALASGAITGRGQRGLPPLKPAQPELEIAHRAGLEQLALRRRQSDPSCLAAPVVAHQPGDGRLDHYHARA